MLNSMPRWFKSLLNWGHTKPDLKKLLKQIPMKRLLFTLLALVALCGCSATNITKFATAIGNDQATWKVNVSTIYGSGTYTRLGAMPGQSVTANSDGSITTVWLYNSSVTNQPISPTAGKMFVVVTNTVIASPANAYTPSQPTPPASPSK